MANNGKLVQTHLACSTLVTILKFHHCVTVNHLLYTTHPKLEIKNYQESVVMLADSLPAVLKDIFDFGSFPQPQNDFSLHGQFWTVR